MTDKRKKRPAEFPTDWHWEAEHDALLRGLAGAHNRLENAKALTGPDRDDRVAEAQSEIDAVHAKLEHYGWGVRAASKRPAGETKTTRAKK